MPSLLLLLSVVMYISCSCDSTERFLEKYEHWNSVCDNSTNNRIPGSVYPTTRWSFTGDTIHKVFNGSKSLQFCSNEKDLASSVANEVKDYSCNVEWLGEIEICGVMSKFARVYLLGDSLTRHMAQTLFMLLSGDFQYGGFPKTKVDKQSPLSGCGCDGQFSEAQVCRNYKHDFSFLDINELGFCSSYESVRNKSISMNTIIYKDTFNSFPDDFCSKDDRPHLIFIQGGSHFDTSTNYFMYLYFDQWMKNINTAAKKCPYDVRFIFVASGVPANSAAVAAKFTDQSDGNTAYFNTNLGEILKAKYPQVIFLNFWNLTHEAVLANRTSDGYHELTDTNVIKTMALLNVMKLVR